MTKKKDKTKPDKSSGPSEKELRQLQEQIEDLQREKDELFEKLQRVSADYANYQKRVPKQVADSVAYEKEKILKSLLPAFDNFERIRHEPKQRIKLDFLAGIIRHPIQHIPERGGLIISR